MTVPRRNQLRDLIVKLDLRLENVEPWNGSGFKTILLIFQLTLQQIYRLLLHYNQLAINDHLIKLRLHRRDDLIDRVSQREVSRIALEESAANRAERTVVKNQLCSGDLDVVRDITAQILDAAISHSHHRRAAWSWSRSRHYLAKCRKRGVCLQVRIRPIPLKAR